jgi:hypothetical protein
MTSDLSWLAMRYADHVRATAFSSRDNALARVEVHRLIPASSKPSEAQDDYSTEVHDLLLVSGFHSNLMHEHHDAGNK